MALAHDVRLLLGATGLSCDVFESYDVALDLTQVGNPWTVHLYRSETGDSAWDVLTRDRAVKAGDWVGLTIDGALQLAGQVSKRQVVNAGPRGVSLVVHGADILHPATRAHADPRTSLGDATTLAAAITALLAPLGIDATIGVDAQAARAVAQGARGGARGVDAAPRARGPRVGRAHAHPGDTVWGLVETYCRTVGLMAWVAPVAERRIGLVLDVPDYAQAPTYQLALYADGRAVPAGSLILTSEYTVDTDDVPTDVYVAAAAARGDAQTGRYLAQVANGGVFADALTAGLVSLQLPAAPHWLPAPHARSQRAAQQDALRLIADRNRRLRRYVCTVQGHGQVTSQGLRLFAINTVARVRDEACRVDESFLIERVEFRGGRRGTTTTLHMHPLGAISLIPEPDA